MIPVYNGERYISEALDSVLQQTRPAEEIIVVDDGSFDHTGQILEGYAGRIRLIRQANAGQSSALNVGVAAATGDTLAFLDADDLWMPTKLALQCAALSSNRALDVVFGGIEQFLSPEIDPEVGGNYFVPDGTHDGVAKSTMLVRRGALDRVGPFDELIISDFIDWYARALALGVRVEVIPELVARRRHHPGNLGRQQRTKIADDALLSLKRAVDRKRTQSAS